MTFVRRFNSMTVLSICVFSLSSFVLQVHLYVLPEPRVEVLTPRGVRISIPDESGVRMFAFHGNVNKEISTNEVGTISGEAFRAQNGRWTIENSRAHLHENDVLHYWSYVQVNGVRHTKESRLIISSMMQDTTHQPDSHERIETSTSEERLLLSEDFNTLNTSLWTREIKMPLSPDYEFCVYHNHNHEKILKVSEGTLRIQPIILEDSYGENATVFGRIQLADCTSNVAMECSRRALSYSILPPVISARITTKPRFSFRYGKIEIRAKFPEGDWLYPEMWLEPRYSTYGPGYASGRILLGIARGNKNLVSVDDVSKIYDRRRLDFGVRTGTSGDIREDTVTRVSEDGPKWTKDFHVYTTMWTSDGFTFLVDNQEVGRLIPHSEDWLRNNSANAGRKAAPFDQEFSIVFGVGVGGVRVFPDRMISSGNLKPWKNVGSKAMQKFWSHKNDWLPSWREDDGKKTAFEIDYIRVWSA